jgi:hypothetical protein
VPSSKRESTKPVDRRVGKQGSNWKTPVRARPLQSRVQRVIRQARAKVGNLRVGHCELGRPSQSSQAQPSQGSRSGLVAGRKASDGNSELEAWIDELANAS